MSKLIKTKTDGNVTFVGKQKQWFETMSYGELLTERRFMRAEKKRVETAMKYVDRVDPRGMWPDILLISKKLSEMSGACDWAIETVEKEMIKRFGKQ